MSKTKRALIQIILFEGNLELLEKRLKFYQNQFDFYIIFESRFDKNLTERKLEVYQSSILDRYENIHYETFNNLQPETLSQWYKNLYFNIGKKLEKICKNFQDTIFICEENEFPNLIDLELIEENLKSYSFFLKQEVISITGYTTHKSKLGCFVLTFSNYLMNKNLFDLIGTNKSDVSNFFTRSFINGCIFENTKNNIVDFGAFKIYVDLEKKTEKLPSYFFEKTEPKKNSKHLVCLEDSELGETNEFKTIIKLSYTENESRTVEGNNQIISTIKPTKKLYGNYAYEDFLNQYLKNEIHRVLKPFVENQNDEVTIISKQIKLSIPFSEILKNPS